MKAKLTTVLIALAIVPFAAAGCGGDDDGGGGTGAAQTDTGAATDTSATEPTETDSAGGTAAPSGGGTKLVISADPSGALKFDKTALEAPAGEVTIEMDNPSPVPHAVAIKDGADASGETVGEGQKSTASADLKPGEYEFYCPVSGHEQAGMKGTLTVK